MSMLFNRKCNALLGVLLFALVSAEVGRAQEASTANSPVLFAKTDNNKPTGRSGDSGNKASTTPQTAQECKLCRWFELQTATLSYRYRFVDSTETTNTTTGVISPARTEVSQTQHREIFKGRFKFDSEGKYSLNALASTGYTLTRTFVGGGGGTFIGEGTVSGSRDTDRDSTNIFLRHLYFSAKPFRGVEVQYGSMPIVKGQSTEITSYDDDAYIMGGRLILSRQKQLFFDEIAVTFAYLGDYNRANINKRYYRMKQSNYHQFLVSKKIGSRATVSSDYTSHEGWDVLREAIKLNVPELKVVDSVRFEAYHKLFSFAPVAVDTTTTGFGGTKKDTGFAFTGEKTLFHRLTLGGGYSQVDKDYNDIGSRMQVTRRSNGTLRYRLSGTSTLNGDKVGRGKHLIFMTDFKFNPEFSLSAFMSTGAHNTDPSFRLRPNNSVLIAFNYNLAKTLQRTGWF